MVSSAKFFDHLDFVIISSINWDENWQIHQQLAVSLVKSGHRVLFVENTGSRAPRINDFGRISGRLHNWVKSTRGFFDVQDNLTVFSPLFIPLPYSGFALAINQFLLSRSIEKWMKIEQFKSVVTISFLPTPLAQSLIEKIDPLLVIYYCADDMSGRAQEKRLKEFEHNFFSKADSVFCSSQVLLERASRFNCQVHLFPAGVDFDKFEVARKCGSLPADLTAISRPIIGFVGAINTVFDQALVVYAAQALPLVNFVLVGPERTDVSLLKACPNIILLGKRRHDDVPLYIKGFDVALIPSLRNAFTDTIYSCKLNEYMAMGVQVVATDLGELRLYVENHGKILEIAETKEEFVEKIRNALISPDITNRDMRIAAAQANSWTERFEGICSVINQLLATKIKARQDWQSRLTNYYRLGRVKIIRAALIFASCYVVLFFTPVLWGVGDILVMRQVPTKADAIVVFSGDGDSGYVSMNYQNRERDALSLYNSKYSDWIVLSSGKGQAISEAEVVRALLMKHGVPSESISVIPKISKSTVENIQLSAAELKRVNARKIIFITAPYHSRRAHLAWRKLAPELEVTTVAVVDTPSNQPVWHTSHEVAKVIAYESLVIVYYWWRGWI